jgi:hypothetical protein
MVHVSLAKRAATRLMAAGMVAVFGLSAAHAGSTRPLYIFAPAADDARLAAQRDIIAARAAGFAERDVPVKEVVGASALRVRFGVPVDQFRVVLVGKDGGVKLSSLKPVSASQIFALIDAMPMRRDEMRR